MFRASIINTFRDYQRTKQFCDSAYNIWKLLRKQGWFIVCFKHFGSDDRKHQKLLICPLLYVGPHTRFVRSYALHKFDKVFSLLVSKLISPMIKNMWRFNLWQIQQFTETSFKHIILNIKWFVAWTYKPIFPFYTNALQGWQIRRHLHLIPYHTVICEAGLILY